MNYLNVLLQVMGGDGSAYSSIFMMVAIIAIFYFFMIRPQTKKQKELQKFRQALQAGDKIVTSGGIYGKIREVKETYLVVEIAENVRIKIDKASVFASAEETQQAAAK